MHAKLLLLAALILQSSSLLFAPAQVGEQLAAPAAANPQTPPRTKYKVRVVYGSLMPERVTGISFDAKTQEYPNPNTPARLKRSRLESQASDSQPTCQTCGEVSTLEHPAGEAIVCYTCRTKSARISPDYKQQHSITTQLKKICETVATIKNRELKEAFATVLNFIDSINLKDYVVAQTTSIDGKCDSIGNLVMNFFYNTETDRFTFEHRTNDQNNGEWVYVDRSMPITDFTNFIASLLDVEEGFFIQ